MKSHKKRYYIGLVCIEVLCNHFVAKFDSGTEIRLVKVLDFEWKVELYTYMLNENMFYCKRTIPICFEFTT